VDMQIDAVEERPGDARLVFLGAARRTTAGTAGLGEIAAAARVHRRDELHARREGDMAVGARDADATGFERLAQRLEGGTVELRQFIKKEHPLMRQGNFTGAGAQPAADKRRQRRGVMWVAERPLAEEAAIPQPAGDRLDHTKFERLRNYVANSGWGGPCPQGAEPFAAFQQCYRSGL